MTLLTIILVLWGLSALLNHARDRKRQAAVAAMKKAEEQRRVDAARLRAEWKERERQAREEYLRVRRLEREQERQAQQLADHEKRISDLEYKAAQAERDIAHWSDQVGNLYALLDIAQLEQEEAVKGGKLDVQIQKRIISLNNQIHSAETKLEKAKHTKARAEQDMTA